MGISWIQTIRAVSSHIIMKFLALFFVAAAAEPFYPYGVGYAGIAPYAGLKSAPCVNAANIPVPCTYGKREAEPFYGGLIGGYGYNPVHAVAATPFGAVHSSHVGLCTNVNGAAVPCGKRKREAEADPALVVAGGYHGVVAPYASAAVPAVYASAPAVAAVAAPAVATYAAPAVAPIAPVATYAGIPNPVHAVTINGVHSSHVGVCTNFVGAQVPC